MSLYTIIARNLRPTLMQIKSLSKSTYKGYRSFTREENEKQLSFRSLKGYFRRENSSSLAVEGLSIPVRSFAETVISQDISIKCFERVKESETSTTRNSGYPGFRTKVLALLVQNWRWYAKSDTPSEGKAVIKDSGGGLGRLGLGTATEDGFFRKMNKSRLEQIKKILRAKNKFKSGTPPTFPKE